MAAVAEMLGEREYFHGRPSTIDATAHSFLANAAWAPIKGPVGDAVRRHANVMTYHERVRDRWFAEPRA